MNRHLPDWFIPALIGFLLGVTLAIAATYILWANRSRPHNELFPTPVPALAAQVQSVDFGL
jgi:hypothetical protein